MAAATAVAIGGLAMSAYSANEQGKAAGRMAGNAKEAAIMSSINAGKEAAARRFEAEQIREQGQQNADKILAKARQFRQSQTVVAAASGFVVDSGTMQDLQDLTDNLAKSDAYAMLLDSAYAASSNEISANNIIETGASAAQMQYRQGAAQADAMSAQSTATLLGGISSFAGTKTGQGLATKLDAKLNAWGM